MEGYHLNAADFLVEVESGVEVAVLASPGTKRNEIGGLHDGHIRVATTSKARDGDANRAIVKLLAKRLGVAKSACELRSGHSSRKKKFLVHGISKAKALALLTDNANSD